MLGCDLIDIDWLVPMDQARRELGPRQVLAGNVDPVAVMRNGTPESITRAIAECHRQAGPHYVVVRRLQVPRDTPPANLLEPFRRLAHSRRSGRGCRAPLEVSH